MRLFIGIPLAPATASDLAAEVHRLQSSKRNSATPDKIRWSAPDSWHITLQFLGKTTTEQYDCVVERLREVRHDPIEVELGRVGTFPRAGVLLVSVQTTPALDSLQQAVTRATLPRGFLPEQRDYHPHITIARKKGKGPGRDGEFRNLLLRPDPLPAFSGFTAESFNLYESTPTPEGSRYDVREQFALQT